MGAIILLLSRFFDPWLAPFWGLVRSSNWFFSPVWMICISIGMSSSVPSLSVLLPARSAWCLWFLGTLCWWGPFCLNGRWGAPPGVHCPRWYLCLFVVSGFVIIR